MTRRGAQVVFFLMILHASACYQLLQSAVLPVDTLFKETFNDAQLISRGWYDFSSAMVDSTNPQNGSACLPFHFAVGASTPTPTKVIRRQFTPTESIYIQFYVRYSENWTGSNRPYHPHEIYLTTTENDKYVGPAWTHLTAYIEHNEGRPLLGLQDGQNIDVSNARKDISATTQTRSTCGCNGTLDGSPTDCYQAGAQWRNGKSWKASDVWFTDDAGSKYKANWHKIEALFVLNTISNGKGDTNGIVKYWYDGLPVISRTNVEFRTAMQPNIQFNQLLIGPYIGDGSPVAQSMWIDELLVATGRDTTTLTDLHDVTHNGINKSEVIATDIYDFTGRKVGTNPQEIENGIWLVVSRFEDGTISTQLYLVNE